MAKLERALGLFGDYGAYVRQGPGARLLNRLAKLPWLFLTLVAIPTLATSVYYLLIAAPIYVSEARFVVRERGHPATAAALGTVLQSVGLSMGENQTDAYEVHEYMQSRDAVQDLVRSHRLQAVLDRPEADFLARFPRPFERVNFENLYENYKRFVTVGYDANTGISTLRVEGFRPGDARAIADALLAGGEGLVNRLNERALADAVDEARRQVLEAEGQALKAESGLTAYRMRVRLVDPDRASVAGLDLLGKLETQLITMRAERAGLAASAPESPQLPILDRRIAAFEAQLDAERLRIAGENDSLAAKMSEYEALMLEREFAVKSLAVAETALETARVDARRKQLYLERVVSPNLPDKAERPRRLLAILTVVITSLLAYGALSLILAGLREHRQK
jgi:capsular polysaccharide transport system permease protein